MTMQQFAALSLDAGRSELVEGEVRMMLPAGGRHGRVAMTCGRRLANHVDEHHLGAVYAAETGFVLARDPDTVRAPDVAFVSAERLPDIGDESAFVPFAPDLAIEVISPTDSFSAVEEKAFSWLAAGTRMVLLVDPANETVHVYRAAGAITVLGKGEVLSAADVVPGWQLAIAKLFQ
ncbi:MAG: Uma2 family endonuclease [Pirellulaceae bacterium]|nr:Uma2 family endonuclease [Pirellulaceae bacterium]